MSSSQTTDSPQVKLIHELVRAFETQDLNFLEKHMHDDLRRVNYPRSLGQPEQTKKDWLQGLRDNMSFWTGDSKVSSTVLNSNLSGLAEPLPTADRSFDHRSSREGRPACSFPKNL